jgi:hypothetical protein
LATLQSRQQVTFQLLGRPVSHHGRNAHPEPDLENTTRHRVVCFLLIVDDLFDRRSTTPAPFLRPGDRGKAGVGFLRLPFLRSREALRHIGVGNVTASVGGLRGALARFSLGRTTTLDEIDVVIDRVTDIFAKAA